MDELCKFWLTFSWKRLLNQSSLSGTQGVWTAAPSNQENVPVTCLETKLFDTCGMGYSLGSALENISPCLYLHVYCRIFTKGFISNSKSLISSFFHTFLIYCSYSSREGLSRNHIIFFLLPKFSQATIRRTDGEWVSCTLIVDFIHLWVKDIQSRPLKLTSACQTCARVSASK